MINSNEEKKLDDLIRKAVERTAASESLVDEIASSPSTWWAVKREIESRKAMSPWPPSKKVWRWLIVAVPATAAAVLLLLFALRPGDVRPSVAALSPQSSEPALKPTQVSITPPTAESLPGPVDAVPETHLRSNTTRRAAIAVRADRAAVHRVVPRVKSSSAEVRSDFIALNYASRPESGQIVRVKVPRSMMVSTGLVGHVERPSDLVDAEVVVGDDGMTQAIRFISGSR